MAVVTGLVSGTVFARDFRVVRLLAEGGMGAVYVVEQLSTGKRRALKVMHLQNVQDPSQQARFAREARVGASIESDHVVEIVAAGVDEVQGVPWLAMELLKGEDLATVVARRGALPAQEVLEIFRQLGHALAAAHRAGLVHRDLKPENIFLAAPRREGVPFTVKLLDFGIAKIIQESTTGETQAMGTPLWMAPEQTERGGTIRPATDVWAMGLIAFRLLTGRNYWTSAVGEGTSAMTLLREIVLEPIDRASVRAESLGVPGMLPPEFDTWFGRCVHRTIAARFADAEDAVRALLPVLASARTTQPQWPSTPLARSEATPTAGAAGLARSEQTPPIGTGADTKTIGATLVLLTAIAGLTALVIVVVLVGIALAGRGRRSVPRVRDRGRPAVHAPAGGRTHVAPPVAGGRTQLFNFRSTGSTRFPFLAAG